MAGPVRTCVGCRTRQSPQGLLRVVLVDGRLTPDPSRQMPGRGAWIHPVADCLAAATRRRAWTRALRAGGSVDADLLASYVAARGGPVA